MSEVKSALIAIYSQCLQQSVFLKVLLLQLVEAYVVQLDVIEAHCYGTDNGE